MNVDTVGYDANSARRHAACLEHARDGVGDRDDDARAAVFPSRAGIVAQLEVDAARDDYYQTQYKLLQSRALVRKVIEDLNLLDDAVPDDFHFLVREQPLLEDLRRPQLVATMNDTDGAMDRLQQAGLTLEQARAAVTRMVEVQASTLGVLHLFLAAGVVFVIAAIAVWCAPRPKQVSMGASH